MAAQSPSPRVVIVGGGAGGLTVASRLARRVDPALITIIEPSDKHYYQPLWTLVGGGVVPREVTEREERDLIPAGVRWVKDAVSEFLPEQRQVLTQGGARLDYDFLVVAAGIQLDWGKVKGLEGNLGRDGICSNYGYEHVARTWPTLQAFRGGDAIFTHPATPIKCGGAPQKIMYLADDAFRRAGVRDQARIHFYSGEAAIFKAPKYAAALERVVARKGVEAHFGHDLVEVRPAAREAVFQRLADQQEVVQRYDLLHVTPPQSAPDFLKRSPLGNAAGWVDVDKATLRHLRYPEIFALGDASSLPTSKTGAAIRKQAPVLVENLLAVARGEAPTASYDGYTSCPLVTGYGRLILAEFGYDLQPRESFPFDQGKERYSMYLLKKDLLPLLYWQGMLKGRA